MIRAPRSWILFVIALILVLVMILVYFTFMQPPAVTGISPGIGPTGGGTTVTITGYNFGGATAVRFGSVPATSYTVNTNTVITATSPAGTAGTVDVRVTKLYATSAIVAGDQFTYTPVPAITSVSLSEGTTTGGTAVTITGVNLLGATSVTFGGITADISSVSATEVRVTTRARAAGTVTVGIVTPNGTATRTDAFTYTAVPTIISVSPSTGTTSGGTAVTITGVNLLGATSVTFGGTTADISSVSATEVRVTTRARAAGTVTVSIVTPNGTATRNNAFTYAAPQVAISLDKDMIYMPLVAGETATNSSFGIFISSNVAWTVTVADSTGRSANLGKMGSYTGGSYDASGPALADYLELEGDPYSGTVTTHTISPPITTTAQTLYTGEALTGQLLSPNTFTQQVSYADPHLSGDSTYRIDLTFTISAR